MQQHAATKKMETKFQLAKELGVSPRTVFNYNKLALDVNDFYDDYPTLNGDTNTRHPLTDYQCWVIKNLIKLGSVMGVRNITHHNPGFGFILNPDIITKLSFDSYVRETPVQVQALLLSA
jgi:hypothetical protein